MSGRHLTRYELEIMDVVWRLGEVTVHDVCANLGRPLAYTTVMTTLGVAGAEKGSSRTYQTRPGLRLSAGRLATTSRETC